MKEFNIRSNIGKAKYVVNYHDGIKKHKDGSQVYELYPVKNKKAMEGLGWVEVKPVPEPTDAKTPRKPKENVEG